MFKNIFIVGISIWIVGCAVTVQKEYAATGGSKADGTIELSYETAALQTAQVDEAQGLALAEQRCSAWGYKSAEAFGGIRRQCEKKGTLHETCFVTKAFQCLD